MTPAPPATNPSPTLAGFLPSPVLAAQTTDTAGVTAFRARLEPGAVALPRRARTADYLTFGLANVPVTLRTLTGSHRVGAHQPWAVARTHEWRIRIDRRADLRLVHLPHPDPSQRAARPLRYDRTHAPAVRAALRTAAPLWVDDRLRMVDDLSVADVALVRLLDTVRAPGLSTDLRALLESFVALASDDAATHDAMRPVVDFIDAHLGDPDLGIDLIAARTRVSRRTLQNAFAAHGGVATYIRRRRVSVAAARITADPRSTPDLDLVATATGFGSRRTLERAIRTAYGCTALQLRRRALSGAA